MGKTTTTTTTVKPLPPISLEAFLDYMGVTSGERLYYVKTYGSSKNKTIPSWESLTSLKRNN